MGKGHSIRKGLVKDHPVLFTPFCFLWLGGVTAENPMEHLLVFVLLTCFFFPLEKEKGFCDEPWLLFIFGVAKVSAQCEGLYLRAYSIQAAHGLYCEV